MSRDPQMSTEDYEAILDFVVEQGYERESIKMVPQAGNIAETP